MSRTILVPVEIEDDFEPGCCYSCPLSYEEHYEDYYGDGDSEDVTYCIFGKNCEECPLRNNPMLNLDKMKDFTPEEEEKYNKSINKLYKDTGLNIFEMRDATPEEQQGVDNYIKSIAKPTGIKFDDLLEDK